MNLGTRKIILWSTVSVLAIILLFFWARSIPGKLGSLPSQDFFGELEMPQIELPALPEINLEELEKLYGQQATTTE